MAKKTVTIKLEGNDWKAALDKAFEKEVKKANVDGFRKGKVPRKIFEQKYGVESLFQEAVQASYPLAFSKMLEDNKELEIVCEPSLEIGEITENGVEFIFGLVEKPTVTLKNYKDIQVDKKEIEVTKEEVDHQIEELRQRYTEVVLKEDAIENGDIAVIDFEGFDDGKPFDGGKAENYELEIGSQSFIPGFEEQLVGMKASEEKDINVTFPEDYHASDLAGKEVTFHVKVNEVKEKVVPEIDEDFFIDLEIEGVTDLESLQKEVEANIRASKEVQAENEFVDQLLEAASKETEVDVPLEMIEDELNRMVGQFGEQLQMQGINLDMYYQLSGMKEADLKEQMREEATKRVLYRLMLEEIVKVEALEVADDEVQKEATALAEKYQMEEDEFLKLFGGLDMVKYDLEVRKAVEFLKSLVA